MSREHTWVGELDEAEATLKALVDPTLHPLVNRLSNCSGMAMVAGEDHVLGVVGLVLRQLGQAELFEVIYASVFEESLVRPGDGRVWLQAQAHLEASA